MRRLTSYRGGTEMPSISLDDSEPESADSCLTTLPTTSIATSPPRYRHKIPGWLPAAGDCQQIYEIGLDKPPKSRRSREMRNRNPPTGFAVPVAPSAKASAFASPLPVYHIKVSPVHKATFFCAVATKIETLRQHPRENAIWTRASNVPLQSVVRLTCSYGGAAFVDRRQPSIAMSVASTSAHPDGGNWDRASTVSQPIYVSSGHYDSSSEQEYEQDILQRYGGGSELQLMEPLILSTEDACSLKPVTHSIPSSTQKNEIDQWLELMSEHGRSSDADAPGDSGVAVCRKAVDALDALLLDLKVCDGGEHSCEEYTESDDDTLVCHY